MTKKFVIVDGYKIVDCVLANDISIIEPLFKNYKIVEASEEDVIVINGILSGDGTFLPQKPHDSWVLDDSKNNWIAPIEFPVHKENEKPVWNEINKEWDLLSLDES
jgi:hypothetical protein